MSIRLIALSLLILSLFFPSPQQSINAQTETFPPVEVAFAVYGQEPIYGLIVNTLESEVRFRLDRESQERILYIEHFQNDQFITIAAVNSSGVFIATQDTILPQPENIASPYLKALYQEEFIQSTIPDQRNALNHTDWYDNYAYQSELSYTHQLVADKLMNAFVHQVHSAESAGEFSTEPIQEQILLLQPVSQQVTRDIPTQTDIEQIMGNQKLFLLSAIQNQLPDFDFQDGLTVLNNASLTDGENIIAVVINPNSNKVYITLEDDVEKVWMINIDGRTVETFTGFDQYTKGNIPSLGITSTDLRILNFSNEQLMNGVIFLASIILIILISANLIYFLRKDRVKS